MASSIFDWINKPHWIPVILGETIDQKWLRNIHNLYYKAGVLTHADRATAIGFIVRIQDVSLNNIARDFLAQIEKRIRTGGPPVPVPIRGGGPRPLITPTPASTPTPTPDPRPWPQLQKSALERYLPVVAAMGFAIFILVIGRKE